MTLRYPFLLILLLPALWGAFHTNYRWGIPSDRPSSRLGRMLARSLPFLLSTILVLAASGPEWRRPLRGTSPVVDFAMVLDGSSSMRAMDDGRESRWDAARRLLKTFIARRPDDRFSLVLFSAHPVTLAPLTSDHVRLVGLLDRLDLTSHDDGTAIGSGLMTAVRRLSDSPARSRVILLLTDGAQNRGRVTALEAAEEAKAQGIRIHTVAMGAPGDSLYPLEGGGFAKLHIDNDPETLRKVAQVTGGEPLAADDPAGLSRSLAAINHLEKTALPVDPPTEGEPMLAPLLMFAGLLALPLALDLGRKRGRKAPTWVEAP